MTAYLFWSGVVFNVTLAGFLALVLWVWFIWPAVEAISMVRWYKACEKFYPTQIKLVPIHKLFIANYEIFGRQFERKSHRFGEWFGVGNWRVYSGADE